MQLPLNVPRQINRRRACSGTGGLACDRMWSCVDSAAARPGNGDFPCMTPDNAFVEPQGMKRAGASLRTTGGGGKKESGHSALNLHRAVVDGKLKSIQLKRAALCRKAFFPTTWSPACGNEGVVEGEGIHLGFACRFEGRPAAFPSTAQDLPIMGRNARSQRSREEYRRSRHPSIRKPIWGRCVIKGTLAHAAVPRAAASMEIGVRKGGLSVKTEAIPRPRAMAVTGMEACSR